MSLGNVLTSKDYPKKMKEVGKEDNYIKIKEVLEALCKKTKEEIEKEKKETFPK